MLHFLCLENWEIILKSCYPRGIYGTNFVSTLSKATMLWHFGKMISGFIKHFCSMTACHCQTRSEKCWKKLGQASSTMMSLRILKRICSVRCSKRKGCIPPEQPCQRLGQGFYSARHIMYYDDVKKHYRQMACVTE